MSCGTAAQKIISEMRSQPGRKWCEIYSNQCHFRPILYTYIGHLC